MLLATAFIIIGFALLIWSADKFIAGAASIADNSGMSKLMIGLTIVAFGTSAPEMLVSLLAALNGSNDIAVGNAVGSNITNVGLVLGVTAFFVSLSFKKRLISIDLPLLFVAMLAAGIVLFDYKITLVESLILAGLVVLYLFYLYKEQNKQPADIPDEVDELIGLSTKKAWGYFIVGLVVLVGSAQLLVKGAVDIATFFGISELVIGLTIVAIGTSLPELAASITSAKQGHHDITFGNIVGSNIFNLLVVLAMPGFVNLHPLDDAVLTRDFLTMTIITLLFFSLLIIHYLLKKPFGKVAGFLLLVPYALYYAFLFIQH